MDVKAEYLAIFSQEASEQLQSWEQSLLALEKHPGDREELDALFRAIHTLKGAAGFIGFEPLTRVAHELESSLSKVRDGGRGFDPRLGETLFKGLDLLKGMIEKFTAGRECAADVDGFLAEVKAVAGADPGDGAQPKSTPLVLADNPASESKGDLSAASPATSTSTCSLAVLIDGPGREAYLRSFLVKARLARIGRILETVPTPEELRDRGGPFQYTVTVATDRDPKTVAEEVAIDQVTVTPIGAAATQQQAPVQEQAPVQPPPPVQPPAAMQEQAPASPVALPEAPVRTAAGPAPAAGFRPEEVVRVSVQKLDSLLNLVGELVIHNAGFAASTEQLRAQLGGTRPFLDLESRIQALSAITRELQDGIMTARMLPIANVFGRFQRVVRDLAKSSGKQVSLEVYGGETELDKKVIDRIGEPLVHLVRNAVDHGIESPEQREAAGKVRFGTVRLGAWQEGDRIRVEVSDDGRGLDREAILRKAIERGMIPQEEEAAASAERILGCIFQPGFSTASTVSDISGRGVGMDVVKRAVEQMSGSVRVRSTRGVGTVVTISLPLTMAIITAVLVEVSGCVCAVPLSSVREVLKIESSMLQAVATGKATLLRGKVLVVVNLADALEGTSTETHLNGSRRRVVVVEREGRRLGLEVDRILGTQEIVIKSLSRHYREVQGLIGASLMGDGRIALIVDVEHVIRKHYREERAADSGGSASVMEVDGSEVAAAPQPPSPPAPQSAPPEPSSPPAPSEGLAPSSPPAPSVPEPASVASIAPDMTLPVTGTRGELLEEVNNSGAIRSSVALSQLTGRDIRVSFPESRVAPLPEVVSLLGGEEATVGGIYVGIQGDLQGAILQVFPGPILPVIDDILHRRPEGTTRDIADIDHSALSEVGNVLAASFIAAIADATGLAVTPEVPAIAIDMCLPVIDSVLARFSLQGEQILFTEAVIYGDGIENVVCHFVLFLETVSLQRLVEVLEAGTRVEALE